MIYSDRESGNLALIWSFSYPIKSKHILIVLLLPNARAFSKHDQQNKPANTALSSTTCHFTQHSLSRSAPSSCVPADPSPQPSSAPWTLLSRARYLSHSAPPSRPPSSLPTGCSSYCPPSPSWTSWWSGCGARRWPTCRITSYRYHKGQGTLPGRHFAGCPGATAGRVGPPQHPATGVPRWPGQPHGVHLPPDAPPGYTRIQ